MSRVVLSGYYGFNNAGDEAILYAIIRTLRKIEPEIEITVLSNDP
ncbi:MAG: polysaccharide pyruvyl transferase CsaB, partial [Bacillota bacterium]